MKIIYTLLLISVLLWTEKAQAQTEKITFEQLQAKIMHPENDTVYIINFWATWCGPCVAELPYFEQAAKTYADKKINILLINLDFISEEAKVAAFIKKKNLQNKVYQLNASDPNKWIDQIDTNWDGAIPVTVFYQSGKKVLFHEGEINQAELNEKINTFIK